MKNNSEQNLVENVNRLKFENRIIISEILGGIYIRLSSKFKL